jgi:hypothetical protein
MNVKATMKEMMSKGRSKTLPGVNVKRLFLFVTQALDK